MASVKGDGKSAFVRDVLTKDSTANPVAINSAWQEAGHEGTISESLVHKMRARMKLTGAQRPRKGADGSGATKKAKHASSGQGQKRGGATKTAGRAKGMNGAQAAPGPVRPPEAASRGDDR